MKNLKLLLFFSVFVCHNIVQSQCDNIETITVCDMTVIDGNTDSIPDGIINLYDEYNNIPGVTPISSTDGVWYDPNFNFALVDTTGDLYTWDLDDASENIDDYQFQLINNSSSCPDGIVLTLNLILGPYSGEAIPAINVNDVNVQICDFGEDPCASEASVDLDQTLLSVPSAHTNGVWSYQGSSPNFIEIDGSIFKASVPYQPGVPLVDEEIFELVYTVQGITPCSPSQETIVTVSVIRQVFAGFGNSTTICETEMIAGNYDNDLDIQDDNFLVNEDIEGVWITDINGQITSETDSVINLRELYDDLILDNPKFGCQRFRFNYFVESRSPVCPDDSSQVMFTIVEYLRPFEQTVASPEFCVGDESLTTFNLYDLLTFTSENGIVFDYPNNECTNWTLISGPSDLGLKRNLQNICTLSLSEEDLDYTSQGTINLSNLTNEDAGTYIFEYKVVPGYNCSDIPVTTIYNPPFGCSINFGGQACQSMTAQVTIIINPVNYPGENTSDLEFCETDFETPLDLITLLQTNDNNDPIYEGPLGTWTDSISGDIIANPFTLPEINNQQTFSFLYSTTTNLNCTDESSLSFIVYEQYQSGEDATIEACTNDSAFNLFDVLGGNPDDVGTWTGPNGFITTDSNAMYDPLISAPGEYIYIVPDNVLCMGNQAKVTVTMATGPNAGEDLQETVCRSDLQFDLLAILDPLAELGGTFIDTDGTGELSGSIIDLSQLTAGTYNFEYIVQGNSLCPVGSAILTLIVQDLNPPSSSDQEFCITDAPTISDIEVNSSSDYNWYSSLTSTDILLDNTLLINGEDYFVANIDSNGCESERISITATVFPITDDVCDCIPDGISINGDGENDDLDLCDLPEAYPNFEIQIFNRYGTIVFKGNRNTELFSGFSNIGNGNNRLPTGVYFYVFDPKDGISKPFQDNFYLGE